MIVVYHHYPWGTAKTLINEERAVVTNALGKESVNVLRGTIRYDAISAKVFADLDGFKKSEKWWFQTGTWWRFNKYSPRGKAQREQKEIWERYSPATYEDS